MGYSHYIYLPEKLKFWRKIRWDFEKGMRVCEDLGVELAGPGGHGKPEITDSYIAFNGKAECRHKEFEFRLLPATRKVVLLPDGATYEYDPHVRYCEGDCSHETCRVEVEGKTYPYLVVPASTYRKVKEEVEKYYCGYLGAGWFEGKEGVVRKKLRPVFVKTNRKPYDIAVQVLFLIVKYYNPEAIIRSDGDADGWEDARLLVFTECGYDVPVPDEVVVMSVEEE